MNEKKGKKIETMITIKGCGGHFDSQPLHKTMLNSLFTVKYYEFVLKISEKHTKYLLLLSFTFH